MPSITYWNRVEPSPRSNDIAPALAARVRDALWMLTRQWQFGELHGEDAASPAWAELRTTSVPMTAWRPPGGALQAIDPLVPLESVVESEPFTFHDAAAVELGQMFEATLAANGFITLVEPFRAKYPVAAATADELLSGDREWLRFKSVAAGRAINGRTLYAEPPATTLPAAVDPGDAGAVTVLVQEFRDWVAGIFGAAGNGDAAAWIPKRLEYSLEVVTAAPPQQSPTLYVCDPGRDGELDWDTFDLAGNRVENPPPGETAAKTRTIIPANVRFRGMPNARWWDFENGSINFGAIEPDRRDLSKLVVMDFMLVQSNDWFAVPLEQNVGTVLRIDSLTVRDVFGGTTVVPATADSRWTMFTSSGGGRGFVLPPTAGSAAMYGEAIEDVRFLHDEMANMVWAVEQTIEGGLGQPFQAYDRSAHRNEPAPPVPAAPNPGRPPLQYILQTTVPENWIPFIPVSVDAATGAIELERAAMLHAGSGLPVAPQGRILKPAAAPYRVAEEEVPRTGVRVQRILARSRGVHGETYLWVSRRKTTSRGPGSSGLRYDIAAPNP